MKVKIKGTDKVFKVLSTKNLIINGSEAISYYIIEDEYGVHQVVSVDLVEKIPSLDSDKATELLNAIPYEDVISFLYDHLGCDYCPLQGKCVIDRPESCYNFLTEYLNK